MILNHAVHSSCTAAIMRYMHRALQPSCGTIIAHCSHHAGRSRVIMMVQCSLVRIRRNRATWDSCLEGGMH